MGHGDFGHATGAQGFCDGSTGQVPPPYYGGPGSLTSFLPQIDAHFFLLLHFLFSFFFFFFSYIFLGCFSKVLFHPENMAELCYTIGMFIIVF